MVRLSLVCCWLYPVIVEMWMPPVELLFLEWKSYNRHKDFVTGQKALAEGLVWASLLSLVLKRRLA